jgi:hypothetical protein
MGRCAAIWDFPFSNGRNSVKSWETKTRDGAPLRVGMVTTDVDAILRYTLLPAYGRQIHMQVCTPVDIERCLYHQTA